MAFGRLDGDAQDALPFRGPAHFVEQDGLAHAAQTGENGALGVAMIADAVQRDGNALQNGFAARQFGRTAARTRGERVASRIHSSCFIQLYTIKV